MVPQPLLDVSVQAESERRLARASVVEERLTSDLAHHPHALKLGLVGNHHGDLRDRLTVLAEDVH